MARATTQTLMPLDRFAELLGLNPVTFNQATATNMSGGGCRDIWFQYDWQSPNLYSRERLAVTLAEVETDIAGFLGYWPAPKWIDENARLVTRFHRRDYFGIGNVDNRFMNKGIRTNYSRIIAVGQRALDLIGTATVGGGELVYNDNDGDGFFEQAVITLPTTATERRDIKVYFAGKDGLPEWEIRPAKDITISGGNVVITIEAWKFIEPDLWDELNATGDLRAIDLQNTIANYVTEVEVYREYPDNTLPSVRFGWESDNVGLGWCPSCNGNGCVDCGNVYQDGCLSIRDPRSGVVAGAAAEYNVDMAKWVGQNWLMTRDPDTVRVYYYAGDTSNYWRANRSLNPMDARMEKAIVDMALARMSEEFCTCTQIKARQRYMQEDLSLVGDSSHLISKRNLDNAFGTRRGEVYAYNALYHFKPKTPKAAAIN